MGQSETTLSEPSELEASELEAERAGSERGLLVRAQAGERGAFRALYEAQGPGALRFLTRLLGDAAAAEDALQETFLRLHGALATLDPERPLRPYLLRVARNVGIASLRRSKPSLEVPSALPAGEGGPVERAARRERSAQIAAALSSLPAGLRAALLLRHDQGLTVRATGEALGVSERTARTRLRDASVCFARALRERGLSPEDSV